MAKAKTTGKVRIKGANAADKTNIAAARAANKAEAETGKAAADTKTSARKVQTVQRGDQAPEAKSTPAAKSAAAKKMFDDADAAVARGLSPDLTVEQYETSQRRGVLGY